eukprot:SAG11_NODE_2593_length_3187_cov_2.489637_3_plen_167_part_00
MTLRCCLVLADHDPLAQPPKNRNTGLGSAAQQQLEGLLEEALSLRRQHRHRQRSAARKVLSRNQICLTAPFPSCSYTPSMCHEYVHLVPCPKLGGGWMDACRRHSRCGNTSPNHLRPKAVLAMAAVETLSSHPNPKRNLKSRITHGTRARVHWLMRLHLRHLPRPL